MVRHKHRIQNTQHHTRKRKQPKNRKNKRQTLQYRYKNFPKQHTPYIFQPSKSMQREYMRTQRRKVAERLGNPRIKQITFHTFRHWKGTMEYHKTKDIMHVRAILGHKSINSTLVYINIEEALFNNIDEWICKVAHTEQEAIQLIEAGFTFVNNLGENAFYKKRKLSCGGPIGFEPMTNGFPQSRPLQNFVIPNGSSNLMLSKEPAVLPGYTTTPHTTKPKRILS